MDEHMLEQLAESRGYDRGFTAGTLHAHELLDKHIENLKHKRAVAEEDGWARYDQMYMFQIEINCVEQMKLLIRTGHYDTEQLNNNKTT